MGKTAVPERAVAPEELDVISKAREASKEVKVKAESITGPIKEAEDSQKPIEHEVTISLTLKEAAGALGYLSGKNKWDVMNDYFDADDHDDVWHQGYSAKDALKFSVKGMD